MQEIPLFIPFIIHYYNYFVNQSENKKLFHHPMMNQSINQSMILNSIHIITNIFPLSFSKNTCSGFSTIKKKFFFSLVLHFLHSIWWIHWILKVSAFYFLFVSKNKKKNIWPLSSPSWNVSTWKSLNECLKSVCEVIGWFFFSFSLQDIYQTGT